MIVFWEKFRICGSKTLPCTGTAVLWYDGKKPADCPAMNI